MGWLYRRKYRDRKGKLRRAKKWTGKWKIPGGGYDEKSLDEDRSIAQQMLADIEKAVKEERRNPARRHAETSLANHLADWERHLRAKGSSAKHVQKTVNRATKIVRACCWAFPEDIDPDKCLEYLAALQEASEPDRPALSQDWYTRRELAALLGIKPGSVCTLIRRRGLTGEGGGPSRRYSRATAEAVLSESSQGLSTTTANYYLREIQSFCRWMVKRSRMPANPVAELSAQSVTELRRARRALSAPELAAIFGATLASARVYRGLTGRERYHLYLMAAGTGFRANELASLKADSFDLAATPPTVTVTGAYAKNKQTAIQPLPPDVAALLRVFLASRPSGPVWSGKWPDDSAEMFRHDLEAAGIPYTLPGPNGPRHADFHCLRHSYITMLIRSGANVKDVQALARHSTIQLTLGLYTHSDLADRAAAVGALPVLTPMLPQEDGHSRPSVTTEGPRLMSDHEPPADGEIGRNAKENAPKPDDEQIGRDGTRTHTPSDGKGILSPVGRNRHADASAHANQEVAPTHPLPQALLTQMLTQAGIPAPLIAAVLALAQPLPSAGRAA